MSTFQRDFQNFKSVCTFFHDSLASWRHRESTYLLKTISGALFIYICKSVMITNCFLVIFSKEARIASVLWNHFGSITVTIVVSGNRILRVRSNVNIWTIADVLKNRASAMVNCNPFPKVPAMMALVFMPKL